MKKPQKEFFGDYLRGSPTFGFYYNDKAFPKPVLERRGSINGFNSLLMTDLEFNKTVIILTNTDTADLIQLGDKIYSEID